RTRAVQERALRGRKGRRGGNAKRKRAFAADDLFVKLHPLELQAFPSYERFELASQLRRSAYSVPANIVEGFARRYRRSRLHFLNISESSLAELEALTNSVGAPLAGLIRSTRRMPLTFGLGVAVGVIS